MTKAPNYLHALSLLFPILHNFHSIPSTKNISNTPSFIKAFEEGFNQVAVNLSKFNNPSLGLLGVHNEVFPNKMFDFKVMPFFLVGHPINSFNPNSPKYYALEKVPNHIFLSKLLSPKKLLFHW
jgi:hypothetical protein